MDRVGAGQGSRSGSRCNFNGASPSFVLPETRANTYIRDGQAIADQIDEASPRSSTCCSSVLRKANKDGAKGSKHDTFHRKR